VGVGVGEPSEFSRGFGGALRDSVGTSAGGVAHDLNNLLAPLMAYAELASEKIEDGHPARADLACIIQGAGRAQGLVRRLMGLPVREERRLGPVHLDTVALEVLDLLRAVLPDSIEVRTDFDDVGGPIWGDATQIHQVVTNLCVNARNAMSASGGVLQLRVGSSCADSTRATDVEEGGRVSLQVIDDGVGMAPATVERIFEPFFTTRADQEGTGVGLAVVHDIVRGHEGRISVESQLGVGTTVTVELPAARRQAPTPPTSTGAAPRLGRVLVVDDLVAITNAVASALASLGYTAETCNSSVEALAAFERDRDGFDLVLVDQTMPVLTGPQLIEKIERIRPGVPIVMMTGYVSDNMGDIARTSRGHPVVQKPFRVGELSTALRSALSLA
jgi:CheY-like chemotaxis protein